MNRGVQVLNDSIVSLFLTPSASSLSSRPQVRRSTSPLFRYLESACVFAASAEAPVFLCAAAPLCVSFRGQFFKSFIKPRVGESHTLEVITASATKVLSSVAFTCLIPPHLVACEKETANGSPGSAISRSSHSLWSEAKVHFGTELLWKPLSLTSSPPVIIYRTLELLCSLCPSSPILSF